MSSESVLLKSIKSHCPICNVKIELKINPDVIEKATNFPVAISLIHCHYTIILFVDANFKVRGVESAMNYDYSEVSANRPKIPELKNENEFDERVYYIGNRSYSDFLEMDIPNLLEKQILLTISRKQEYISIRELREKMKKVGKALNMNVDELLIEKVVTKYANEGIISKFTIK